MGSGDSTNQGLHAISNRGHSRGPMWSSGDSSSGARRSDGGRRGILSLGPSTWLTGWRSDGLSLRWVSQDFPTFQAWGKLISVKKRESYADITMQEQNKTVQGTSVMHTR